MDARPSHRQRPWLAPWRSPVWLLAHPWVIPALLAGYAVVFGASVRWPVLSSLVLAMLLLVAWFTLGQWEYRRIQTEAVRCGFRARFVVVGPQRWWARQLRRLGYPYPLIGPLWEIHALHAVHWSGETPKAAAQAFRATQVRDLQRWLAERPAGVTLLITTFNQWAPGERDLLDTVHAWAYAGPAHPRLPAYFTPRRMQTIQTQMFGAVISTTVRTDPAHWNTWVIPPRMTDAQARLRPSRGTGRWQLAPEGVPAEALVPSDRQATVAPDAPGGGPE